MNALVSDKYISTVPNTMNSHLQLPVVFKEQFCGSLLLPLALTNFLSSLAALLLSHGVGGMIYS